MNQIPEPMFTVLNETVIQHIENADNCTNKQRLKAEEDFYNKDILEIIQASRGRLNYHRFKYILFCISDDYDFYGLIKRDRDVSVNIRDDSVI